MRTLLARRQAALDGGATAIGWKIGLNVAALQQHFGLTGPVVGYLTDATVSPIGTPVDIGGWAHPALEVEVAIRVGEDGEVGALAPALELVDLDLPFDSLEPILAGNICHRGVIFGPEAAVPDRRDLSVRVASGSAEVAHGHLDEAPEVTVGVVRAFLEAHGARLLPGEWIIAGSLIAPLAVAPGDRFEVSFGPLGSLGVAFSEGPTPPR
jgi:2-oxo-hept-3-ene-1,7-dioate hydratase